MRFGFPQPSSNYTGTESAANLNLSNAKSVTVKAKWTDIRTIFDITYMQDMTSTVCNNTVTPNTNATTLVWSKSTDKTKVPRTVLIDNRDNNKYLVSKLADGNCWMSQNLNLTLSTSKTLTNSNTDLNSKTTYKPERNTETSSTTSTWELEEYTSKSYKPDTSSAYYRNGTTRSSSPTSTANSYLWESAGIYYNWDAAIAGNGASQTVNSGTASDSICPKGWRLPNEYGTKSFYNLVVTTYNMSLSADDVLKLTTAPLNFVNAGHYFSYNTTGDDLIYTLQLGRVSHLWSGAADSSVYSYRFKIHEHDGTIFTKEWKGIGLNIRCVSR